MRITAAAVLSFILFNSALASNELPKVDQLRAASLKNENAGKIAEISVRKLEEKCSDFGDHQTSLYMNSGYHATLVALQAVLPRGVFSQLQLDSLQYSDCDNFDSALNYLNTQLGIKK